MSDLTQRAMISSSVSILNQRALQGQAKSACRLCLCERSFPCCLILFPPCFLTSHPSAHIRFTEERVYLYNLRSENRRHAIGAWFANVEDEAENSVVLFLGNTHAAESAVKSGSG